MNLEVGQVVLAQAKHEAGSEAFGIDPVEQFVVCVEPCLHLRRDASLDQGSEFIEQPLLPDRIGDKGESLLELVEHEHWYPAPVLAIAPVRAAVVQQLPQQSGITDRVLIWQYGVLPSDLVGLGFDFQPAEELR